MLEDEEENEISQKNLDFIEYSLTNKTMMTQDLEEQCIEYLKQEFQFFKDLSKVGVDIKKMMQYLSFMRSLEVKTLFQEGTFFSLDQMYIVFSGQCEVYKTRNEFKNFDGFGNEIIMNEHVILENPTSPMNITQQHQTSLIVDDRKELLIQENNMLKT